MDEVDAIEERRQEAIRKLLAIRQVQLREATRLVEAERLQILEEKRETIEGWGQPRPDDVPPVRNHLPTFDIVGDAAVNSEITGFFSGVARRIWSAPDPALAMDLLMNGPKPRKRGRKRSEKRFRDALELVIKVHVRKKSGMTLTVALREIANEREITGDRTKNDQNGGDAAYVRTEKAYHRAMEDLEVRASLGLMGY